LNARDAGEEATSNRRLNDGMLHMPLFGPNIKKMMERRDIEGLMKELWNKDEKVCIEVVKALGVLKHIEGLVEALKHGYQSVRFEAISMLEGSETPEVTEALIDVLVKEKAENVWQRAFEVLGKFKMVNEKTWMLIGAELLKAELEEDFVREFVRNPNALEVIRNRALTCFEKASEINPSIDVLFSIGELLRLHVPKARGMINELLKNALRYYEKMIEIDPNDARGWEGKGASLYGLNRDEEAITCCERALEIEPKLAVARYTLCAIYYKKGNYKAVEFLAREALQYAPEDVKSHIFLSEALLLSNKLIEAEAEMHKALEILDQSEYIEPEDLSAVHAQLGIIYVMRGSREKAIEEFKKAIQANRRDPWPYKLLSAYMFLDAMDAATKGTPLERRARLISVAEVRDAEVAFQDASELGI
jgi:tetratricopeptide (TPR) repeat protein